MLLIAALLLGGPDGEDDVTARIVRLCGAADAEELDAQVLERFEALRHHPLALNLASRSRLLSCGLLTSYQVASLLDYRERTGGILSLTELGTVDGFHADFVSDLAPFISLEGERGRSGPAGHSLEGQAARNASGWNLSARYHLTAGERFETAFALRLPPGGPATCTLTAAFYGRRHLGKIIVGDFQARFGQGLALWSGFSLSGVSSPASLLRRPSGLSRSISWSATGYRGVAADFAFGRWSVSAALGLPGLRPWMEAGKPWQPALLPLLNVSWLGRNGQVGLTGLCRADASSGALSLAKLSLDGRACWRGVDGFAEGAWDFLSRKPAGLAGVVFPWGKTRLGVALRYYPAGFSAAEAGALRSSTRTTDEAGLSLTGQRGSWTASLDGVWHPSSGRRQLKLLLSGSATGGAWTWKWRLSERLRGEAPVQRADLRADVLWQRGEWNAAARLNAVYSRQLALLGYLEGGWKREAGSLYLRGTLFRVDNWDDRVYCYERDAPGHFTVPAYYGRGYALSLVGSFRHHWPGLRLKSYLRASWTAWPWSEKPKPGVAGLRVQLMLDF